MSRPPLPSLSLSTVSLQSLGFTMEVACLLSPALTNKPHDSEVGGQQASHDLRGNLKCIILMFVKYYAGCIGIDHLALIFPLRLLQEESHFSCA